MPIKNFTPEQRRVSLALAHRLRHRRSEILNGCQFGGRYPDVIVTMSGMSAPTDEIRAIRGIRVRSFLMALPGVGPITADKVMEDLGIHARRKLGGLTAGQRSRLLKWLRDKQVSEAERSA